MNFKHSRALLAITAALAGPAAMAADEQGHDHGAPATQTGPALPRFAAVSETFELVGIVDGKQLTVYLDRFTDNSPVKGAKVDLQVGDTKLALKPHGDGEYEATLAEELEPGLVAVTATVVAGNETDLLAGELDLHDDARAEGSHTHGWREYASWAAGVLVALAAVAWLGRRTLAARRVRLGGAA